MRPLAWKSFCPSVMSCVVKRVSPLSVTPLSGWGMELV